MSTPSPARLALLASLLCTCLVRAEPVPIGRYVALPAPSAAGHPYAASAADARRSGRSRLLAPSEPPVRQWGKNLTPRTLLPPAVRRDGTLLVGNNQGLITLDPQGNELKALSPGQVRFTPALTSDGSAVFIAGGALRRLDPRGELRALLPAARLRGQLLVLDSGLVVAAGSEGELYVVDLEGNLIASQPLTDRAPRFSAYLGDGLVAIASQEPLLTLLSPQGGGERSVRLPGALVANPIATPARTLLGVTEHGSVIEVDVSGVVRVWAELGPGAVSSAPALGRDGGLRVPLRHGEIVCLGDGGRERWRRGIDGPPSAITLDANDAALVISLRGTLYALEPDGTMRFRQRTELLGASRPVLAPDGVIYLVARGGRIETFR